MEVLSEAQTRIRAHDFEGALALLRSEIDGGGRPEAKALVERLVALTQGRARPQDHGLPLQVAPHLLVACMPKSGSTFLTQVLSEVTGFDHRYAFYAGHQNEQDLHRASLLHAVLRPAVIQQHLRATERNLQLLQGLRTRPVVLVRNVFDALVSMRDMIDKGGVESVFFPTEPFGASPFSALDIQIRTRAIVIQKSLWYVEMFASWFRAARAHRIEALFLSYETLMADKPGCVARVLEHSGIDYDFDNVAAAVVSVEGDKARSRKNVGSSGRGRELPETLKQYIRGHTRFFADVDFEMVGL